MWKDIKGYYYKYRINDDGEVQRYWPGKNEWRTKKPYKGGAKRWSGKRLVVKLTVAPNKYAEVPVVDLMIDAFMGGRSAHPNKVITHINGCSHDCSLYNLAWTTRKALGKRVGGAGRKTVFKVDKNGEVVQIFRSLSECAKHEYIHRITLYRMINKKTPAEKSCTGYAYRLEDEDGRRK